jgi:hypothetical protein
VSTLTAGTSSCISMALGAGNSVHICENPPGRRRRPLVTLDLAAARYVDHYPVRGLFHGH